MKEYIQLGDEKAVRAEGKGSVLVSTKQGNKLIT